MKIIPNKIQIKNWKLITWVGYISFWLASLGILLSITIFVYQEFIKPNYSKLSYGLFKELKDENLSKKKLDELFYRIEKELYQKIDREIWDSYAATIVSIYQQIDSSSNIQMSETIFSDQTKKSRTIDIAIHSNLLGHEILLAIKLLPINEPVDINVIEYFSQVLNDIKASKGIIICNGGYTDEALEYAKMNMIDLCKLVDATSRDWKEDISIPVVLKIINPDFSYDMIVSRKTNDRFTNDSIPMIFSDDNGKSRFTLPDLFIAKWNSKEIPHITDSIIKFPIANKNLKVLTLKKEWRTVSELNIYCKVRESYYLKYFTPVKFKALENMVTGQLTISEVMMAKFNFVKDGSWVRVNPEKINLKGFVISMDTEPKLKSKDFRTNLKEKGDTLKQTIIVFPNNK